MGQKVNRLRFNRETLRSLNNQILARNLQTPEMKQAAGGVQWSGYCSQAIWLAMTYIVPSSELTSIVDASGEVTPQTPSIVTTSKPYNSDTPASGWACVGGGKTVRTCFTDNC
ncbi:MAG: hypothetical protein HJJLKODD_01497 [Phycisphaerae bacterium]|nr:hypothetical protein [Phycisphaerae bacterium]